MKSTEKKTHPMNRGNCCRINLQNVISDPGVVENREALAVGRKLLTCEKFSFSLTFCN
jgi:hypothetical protein